MATTYQPGVPFYQMVVHGYVDYAGLPLNHSESLRVSMLKTIETGASPYFQLGASSASKIKDTAFADLFSMDYRVWLQCAVGFYEAADEVLGDVRTQRIVRHRELSEGIFETVYENGIHRNVATGLRTLAQRFSAGVWCLMFQGGTQDETTNRLRLSLQQKRHSGMCSCCLSPLVSSCSSSTRSFSR